MPPAEVKRQPSPEAHRDAGLAERRKPTFEVVARSLHHVGLPMQDPVTLLVVDIFGVARIALGPVVWHRTERSRRGHCGGIVLPGQPRQRRSDRIDAANCEDMGGGLKLQQTRVGRQFQ